MTEFVSVKDIIEATGIKRRTIYYWIENDLFPKPKREGGKGPGNEALWPKSAIRYAVLMAKDHPSLVRQIMRLEGRNKP